MKTKSSFYGWTLLIIVGLCYMFSSAFVLTTGAVVNPMMLKDPNLALNGKILGLGFTVFILCQGLPAPLVGQFIARFGNRKSYMVGGLLMILGGFCMAMFVKSGLGYIISFGIILSIGSIMAGQITMQSSVSFWFLRRRALAMSVAMIMGGLGSFAAPYIVNFIIKSTGNNWQNAWFFVCVLGVIIIALVAIFVVNKPADIGQVPDGAESNLKNSGKEQKPDNVFKTTAEITYGQALRTKNFWFIAIAATAAFCCFSLTVSQGMIHFTSMGFERVAVAGALAMLGIARLFGTFSVGVLGDKVNPVRIFGLYLIVLAVGIFASANHTDRFFVTYIYFILTGIGFGGCATLTPVIVGNYFGTHSYPKNLGTVMMCTSLVSSTIPFIGGSFFDATGSVTPAFYLTGIIALIGAAATFFIREKKVK